MENEKRRGIIEKNKREKIIETYLNKHKKELCNTI